MVNSFLVSTSDIAELVDERVSVVSTWRSRFDSGHGAFPAPVGGTPSRPLFALDEVLDWISRNRPEKDVLGRLLRVQIWSAIRTMSRSVDQFDLVLRLHRRFALRKQELEQRSLSHSPSVDLHLATDPNLSVEVQLIESLVDSASAHDLVEVSDFVLARMGAGYGRAGGEVGAVESRISTLLARALLAWHSDLPDDPLLYDPACGLGETLIQAAMQLRRFGKRVTVVAVEVNPEIAQIARIRFDLRDIPATISIADSLATHQFPDERPDIVVVEPPLAMRWVGVWGPDDPRSGYGPPPTRSADLAWVVDAVSRLSGESRALVVTTMGALSNEGAEERVRTALVKSGAVETIVALPPNLLQYSSIPLALWVLRAPFDAGGNLTVAFLDASTPPDTQKADAQHAWLLKNIALWLIDPLAANPIDDVTSAVSHLDDLLDAGGMDLTPMRWAALVDHFGALEHLHSLSHLLGSDLRDFQRFAAPDFTELQRTMHVVTVREMTEFPNSREAKLWSGRGVPEDDRTDDVITARNISDGALRSAPTHPDRATGFRTAPGDVVFTTTSRVRAVVDREGGHRIGKGVYALRLEPSSRFNPEYVALCLSARWNDRHQKGSAVTRAKPADLEIPLVPLDDQAQWVARFRELHKLIAAATNLREVAQDLEIAAQNVLRFVQPDAT